LSYLDPPDSGRRFTGIAVVLVFHAFLIYALVTGLARKVVEVIVPPLETKIVEEAKAPPPDKPPPPPPPKLAAPPPPFIPPPEVRVEAPPMANTITAVSDVKPASEAPVPQVQHARTAPVVNASGCAKPEYPPASLRANETGLVVLSFLIGVDGNVLDSKVLRSSGSRRLDEAARKALGLCHFRPGTVDGKPEQSWARIEYEWKIE